MSVFDYQLVAGSDHLLGLIVLQSDERIELDFRRLLPEELPFLVSRVPSGVDVTPQTLQAMETQIPKAAGLFPRNAAFDAVGYGCTSGAAQIGPGRVFELVKDATGTRAVTEPLSALVAACQALGIGRLAFLSPYIEAVSARLRDVLREGGIETPVFGSFDEAEEARVVRIAPHSIRNAARDLARSGNVEGVFLSCTNLDTLDVIEPLETEIGIPVLSSNQVLAWHMCRLAGTRWHAARAPGRLFQAT